MKFKVKVEAEYSVSQKNAIEWWGTMDPEEVARRDTPNVAQEIERGTILRNVRVTLKPIPA